MKIAQSILALTVLCLAGSGCAHTKAQIASSSHAQASFSAYRTLLVSVSASSPDFDDDAVLLRRKTLEALKARRAFEKIAWIAADKTAPQWDLRLNLRITLEDRANAFLRWLVGNLAGSDDVTIEGRWVDNKTGRELDHFLVQASTKDLVWWQSGIDPDVEGCAEQIGRYAVRHLREAPSAASQPNRLPAGKTAPR